MRARFFLNQPREKLKTASPPSRAALDFHRSLPGYRATPLLDAPELARSLGIGQVLVKDESNRLGLPAFKILGASWAVYRALTARATSAAVAEGRASGRPGPAEAGPSAGLESSTTFDQVVRQFASLRPLTLVTATDGNHGRAVAHVAALFGLGAKIFVPAGTAQARIDGIASEGATVEIVDGTYDEAVERAARDANDRCLVISDTSWHGYEQIPQWVAEGYATILWEIEDELARRGERDPDLFPVQFGVGALATAVVRHYRAKAESQPRIVSVEPLRAACALASIESGKIVTLPGPHDSIMAGLNCGRVSMVAWPIAACGIDAFLAIPDERAREAMRALARLGVVAGETGAAGLAGLIELLTGPENAQRRAELDLNQNSRALIIVTEGATDPESYARIVGA